MGGGGGGGAAPPPPPPPAPRIIEMIPDVLLYRDIPMPAIELGLYSQRGDPVIPFCTKVIKSFYTRYQGVAVTLVPSCSKTGLKVCL
jgi:hypothetical protein